MTLHPRFGRNYATPREAETAFMAGAWFIDDDRNPVTITDLRRRDVRRVSIVFAQGRAPLVLDI